MPLSSISSSALNNHRMNTFADNNTDNASNTGNRPITHGNTESAQAANNASTELQRISLAAPPNQPKANPTLYGDPLNAPTWPQNRALENIGALHTFHRLQDFDTQTTLPLPPLLTELPNHSTVIDFGAGSGRLLYEIKEAAHQRNHAMTTIAVSGTKLNEEQHLKGENAIDHVYYTLVPNNTILLEQHRGQADLILDSYGPATYTDNPIHLLIYAALLLKPEGQFSCLSSTGHPGTECTDDLERPRPSMFGDAVTRAKIINFFKQHLDIHDLTMKASVIRSEVQVGQLKVDLLTQFSGSQQAAGLCNTRTASMSPLTFYNDLITLADREIGKPIEDSDNDWFIAGRFKVVTKHYTQQAR